MLAEGKRILLSLLELFGLLEKMNIPEVERTFGSWLREIKGFFIRTTPKLRILLVGNQSPPLRKALENYGIGSTTTYPQ